MIRIICVFVLGIILGTSCRAQETIREDGAVVRYSGVSEAHAQAIARTVSAARALAIEKFQFEMPETIFVEVMADPSRKVRLFNDGQDRFSLTVRSEEDLAQPSSSGIFHLYGLCHEVGHLAMYRPIRDHSWLSFGAAEGWAHYLGSRLVDDVYEREGPDLWPDQYDYREDGTTRLDKQLASNSSSPTTVGAGQWKEMAEIVGDEKLATIFAAWGKTDVNSVEPGPDLKSALASAVDDQQLADWWDRVEDSLVIKRPKSGFSAQTIAADQLDGQPREVAHDDDTQANKKSIAGSGHGVRFESGSVAPSYLTAVQLHGSRYGRPAPPKEDFSVWLCDEDFNQIAEFKFPYSKFERGDPAWVTLETKPTRVPDRFIVCVGFNPTGTKGVFVGYDSEASGNSLTGLPGRAPAEFQLGDWLIRATLDGARHDNVLIAETVDDEKKPPLRQRTWTDTTGKFSVVAELVDVRNGKVRLRKANGEIVSVPITKLSAADREFLKDNRQ